jgi:hypothetical protein
MKEPKSIHRPLRLGVKLTHAKTQSPQRNSGAKFPRFVLLVFLAVLFCAPAIAQNKTVIKDARAKAMLLGKHKLSLQWISWDYFGTANVTQKSGVFYLKGEQKGRGESKADYVKVAGAITQIDKTSFTFNGTILIKVGTNNNGEECKREGEMTFRITGKRKYWRLMEMDNPCEGITDYVDIYFR